MSRVTRDSFIRPIIGSVFDRDVLSWALREAGYTGVEDLTEIADDRHSLAWRPLVDHYSLIMRATRS